MRVLHVAAEVFPLVKTGGLADVVGALPQALVRQGEDVRLLLPGYPAIADAVLQQKTVVELGPLFGAGRIALRLGSMPHSQVPAYVVDARWLYRRGGGPYQAADGSEWPDNLQRFALLGWMAAHLAGGELDPDWRPELLHAHDWHAAMACAYLAAHPANAVPSVFTVHNLAYQGLFPSHEFAQLGLPLAFMQSHGVEYHGQLSFMKAGLKYASRITTVSPTYAREIATHEFGCGLDGVIRSRGGEVSGILNGVDGSVWDPASDSGLAARYSAADLAGKLRNKAALRHEMGLDEAKPEAPLFGVVSRLTAQKGLDLVLAALLHLDVELRVARTDPFIEQEDVRLDHCRDGDGEPQAHAGRVGGERLLDVVAELGEIQHARNEFLDVLDREAHLQAADIDVLEPRGFGAEAERNVEQALCRAVHGQRALARRIDAGEQAQQRALPGAVAADDAETFARFEIERDVVEQRRHAPLGARQVEVDEKLARVDENAALGRRDHRHVQRDAKRADEWNCHGHGHVIKPTAPRSDCSGW